MNWKWTTAYSLAFSLVFVEFFGHVVSDRLSMWAIYAAAPVLRDLNSAFGVTCSHAVGHALAFMVGAAGTFAFVLPSSMVLNHPLKRIFSALVMTVPVEAIMLTGEAPQGVAGWATVMQPAAGAALAAVTMLRISRR